MSQHKDNRPFESAAPVPSALGDGAVLQRVADIAPNIIYVFNHDTQSNEYSNRELVKALGYSAAEVKEMGARLMPTLLHPQDQSKVADHFCKIRALEDGEVAEVEYRMRHSDGHWITLLSHDTVFDRNADGSVRSHSGVATDISFHKSVLERLEAEKRTADAANEELRAFAYSISHDIKAPSNTIQLLLNELHETQHDKMDEDGRQLVSYGLNAVERMQRLIEDVLSYTRLIGEPTVMQPLALDRVVQGVVDKLAAKISDRSAQVKISPMPEVIGDADSLSILFENLLVNALQYVARGTAPRIEIADITNPDADHFAIAVRDNGIGIPADAQDRIFTMFKRLHLQEEYEGTGLGLAICRRVSLNHGGRMSVSAREEGGTTFTLSLPRP